jgi:phosphoglycerate dehydrogenase-like enzyme
MMFANVAILDDYLGCARELADWTGVDARATVTVFREPVRDPVADLHDFDVLCLMRDRMPLPATTLAQLPKLKLISFTGAANATLDIAAAQAQGIQVCRTERGRLDSTSELIWALIMATVRALPANYAALRAGAWQRSLGVVLGGRTIGIIGLGRLGRPTAAYARAFGMQVLAWSRHLTEEHAAAHGARRVELDALLALSDVVSVHVPLSQDSRGLIGARELALMKPTAYLINTSRGPIVDEAALVAALHGGRLAGAGLDVYDTEPLPADHPLLGAPNTVLLPHLGFVTRESLTLMYEDTVENVLAWLDGSPIRLVDAAG